MDQATQIAGRLEKAILAGEFGPGERLPSERDLSGRLGVSRGVVREALGRLASLGLIQSRHGSGTRVLAPDPRPVEVGFERLLTGPIFRLEHLAQVRLPLEAAMAEQAARSRTEDHLARLEKSQKVLANPRRSLKAHVQADMDFHALLAEATNNPLFPVVLAPIQRLLIESRRRTLDRYGATLAFRHHETILAAVREKNPAGAGQAMREHLLANFEHLRNLEER